MISAHFSNFFVKKTKVTIWAESTIGISPFLFFLFKSITGQWYYVIYQVLKREVAWCSDWTTLLKRLKAKGIDVRFKYKGNTHEVQGIIFTKNGYHFNGSKIDRSFSYSKIDKALNGINQAEYQREYIWTAPYADKPFREQGIGAYQRFIRLVGLHFFARCG